MNTMWTNRWQCPKNSLFLNSTYNQHEIKPPPCAYLALQTFSRCVTTHLLLINILARDAVCADELDFVMSAQSLVITTAGEKLIPPFQAVIVAAKTI